MFSVLVSYFSEEKRTVMVQHYRSNGFETVNAKNVSKFVVDLLAEDQIPLTNQILQVTCVGKTLDLKHC